MAQLANLQGIIGVVVGLGASPTLDAWKTRRNERRTLDSKTAEQAQEALIKLQRLEQMPGEEYERRQRRGRTEEREEDFDAARDAWERPRKELVDQLQASTGRFSKKKVREHLALVHTVLNRWYDLWYEVNVAESSSRHVACEFGVDCLNAVLRRGRMPPVPEAFTSYMVGFELADERLEANQRNQLEWMRQQREERRRQLKGPQEEDDAAD
jgi:hypothetical protein